MSMDNGCAVSVCVREGFMPVRIVKVDYIANEGPNSCLDRALLKKFGESRHTVGEALGIPVAVLFAG